QQAFRAGANRFYDKWMPTFLETGRLEAELTVEEKALLDSAREKEAKQSDEEKPTKEEKALLDRIRKQAANLSSWPMYAGVVGGLVGGILADWVLKRTGSRRAGRKGVAIISLLVGSLFFVAAYYTADLTVAVLFFSAGAFITMFAAPCAYALTMDLGGRN